MDSVGCPCRGNTRFLIIFEIKRGVKGRLKIPLLIWTSEAAKGIIYQNRLEVQPTSPPEKNKPQKESSMKTALLLALAAAGFFVEDAQKPKVMQLTAADQGKTVKAAVGLPFDIVLEGNATTGYQWQVAKIDGDAVAQDGKPDYIQKKHPQGMVGVGGTYVFHFKVVKPGETKIKLTYLRPWEKNTPPAKTFEAVIDSK
jgi:inhibitor of cysteine peptidase